MASDRRLAKRPARRGAGDETGRLSFKQRFAALERRRATLLERLALLERTHLRSGPGHKQARELLNRIFRRSDLASRAAVLNSAAWLIGILERL
jgi:hypothetical protein